MSVVTVIHSPEEAEGLIRWSLLLALSYEDNHLTVLHSPGIDKNEVKRHVAGWEKDHPAIPNVEAKPLSALPQEEEILDVLRKPSVKFAVLGQNREMVPDRTLMRLNRRIFDRAVCDTILFRLGGGPMVDCDSVLIPSAGGPHSAVALRLGSRCANRFDGFVTPLYVEPEIGEEDGRAVGGRVLDRVISEAGVDTSDEEHIRPEVVVANDVGEGIYEAAHRHNYDLILIGASSSLSVKRKLFGAIPSRMLEGEDSAAIAVIRKRYPVAHRLRDALERFFRLRVPQLDREDRIALFDRLQTQSRWSFDFFALILLSTGIASLGLMQDSPAVVIGAMLVAPLMTPLLGSGLALVQGNLPLMQTCLRSILRGFLAAILVGGFLGWVGPLDEVSRELAARGNPTLLDFGVAALSGLAASYCIARPGLSSALAGVAIAAALVPPIATVGISLVLQDWDNAQGAALLFATNVVAIILAASFTFFAIGVRGHMGRKQLWARRSVVWLLIMLVILIVPLATVLLKKAAG